MTSSSTWKRAVAVVAMSLCAALLVPLYAFDPSDASSTAFRFYPKCPFHALTGLNCPGCGSTRALHALLHGDVATAFGFNAVFVVALPFILVWLAVELLALFGKARSVTIKPAAAYALVAGMLAWGVIRNVLHV